MSGPAPEIDQLTPEQLAIHKKLDNLEYFASKNIYIKTKKGGQPQLLVFNKAQKYIDKCIEEMLAETGWVRVIIIKGRQQGSSTYVCARFFKKALSKSGLGIYILTHEAKATTTLFGKVALANELCPGPVKPALETDNRTTLAFSNKTEYAVGTAGSSNTGRSLTAQCMHASEAAHYVDVESLDAGLFEIVPDLPGTEIIYETTCNGMNWFEEFTQEALAGKNDFRVIFVPWFWTDEYRRKITDNDGTDHKGRLLLDEDEQQYRQDRKDEGEDLDDEQMLWRRKKIIKLKSAKKFKQEYPATIQEAFQASGDGFYDNEIVRRAINRRLPLDTNQPNIWGVDVGGDKQGDRTVLVNRRGRVIPTIRVHTEMNAVKLAAIVKDLVDLEGADKVFIDRGYGQGAIDILVADGYGQYVDGVSFAETADDDQYANKRAEMLFRFKDWLDPSNGEVQLPNTKTEKNSDKRRITEAMASDIAMIPEPEERGGRWVFTAKKELKKKFRRSPDILDAIILTFARKVRVSARNRSTHTANTRNGSSLQTLRRTRTGTFEGRTGSGIQTMKARRGA